MVFKTVVSKESGKFISFKDDDFYEVEVPQLYSDTSDVNIIQWIDDYQYYGISQTFNDKFNIIQLIIIKK